MKKQPFIVFGGRENHHHSHSANITVTEKRAPTDDSLRISDEMHEKVLNRIIQHFKVSNSILDIYVIILQVPALDTGYRVISKFSINGKEHKVETEISYQDYRELERQAVREGGMAKIPLIHRIFDEFSKQISALISQELFQTEFFKQIQ
jgi:hypothetical protein